MKAITLVNFFFVILIGLTSISCEKETVGKKPDIDETDVEGPIISHANLSRLIETKTVLKYNIADASGSVEFEVYVDGELILQGANDSIAFDIDPFNYPVGEISVVIKAFDKFRNETQVSETFDIKRLLLRIPQSNFKDSYYTKYYVLINSSSGQLLNLKKVEPFEDISIYANANYNASEFTASLFSYPTDNNSNGANLMKSFVSIPNGTILPTIETIGTEDNYFEDFQIDERRTLSFNTEDPVDIGGNGYFFLNNTILHYSSSIDTNFFLAKSTTYDTANAQDNFKYLIVKDQDKFSYDESDFLTANSFFEVDIPMEFKSEKNGEFRCIVNGYRSEKDYLSNRGHTIMGLSTANINIFEEGLFVPEINNFEVYDKILIASVGDNYKWATKQKGLEFQPLPIMSIEHNQDEIIASGDFNQIVFRYANYFVENGSYDFFDWRFYETARGRITIPYGDFELPQEIKQILDDKQLKPKSSSNDGTGTYVTLVNIKNYTDYINRMFEHNYYYDHTEWTSLELHLNP